MTYAALHLALLSAEAVRTRTTHLYQISNLFTKIHICVVCMYAVLHLALLSAEAVRKHTAHLCNISYCVLVQEHFLLPVISLLHDRTAVTLNLHSI